MTFSSEERAELIAALSRTAEMVGLLLDALDVLLVSYVAGQQPSAGDVERLTEHSALWRQQLEKLRSRLASLTIEPPTSAMRLWRCRTCTPGGRLLAQPAAAVAELNESIRALGATTRDRFMRRVYASACEGPVDPKTYEAVLKWVLTDRLAG
jgi:hypothetical protein